MENSPITTNADVLTSPDVKKQKNKKLIIAVGLVGIIIVIAAVSLLITSFRKPSSTSENKTASEIQLKTEYQNPFDKKTQYVNPFSGYKNPFDQIK